MGIRSLASRILGSVVSGLTGAGAKIVTGPVKDISGTAKGVTGIRRDLVETKLAEFRVEEHERVTQRATFEDVRRYDPKAQRLIKLGEAEPPPEIKRLTFLLKAENWRTYWKEIILLAFVTVAGFAIPLGLKMFNQEHSNPTSVIPKVPAPATLTLPTPEAGQTEPDVTLLSKEQVSALIRNNLDKNKVELALRELGEMKDGAAKEEECEHIFNFSIDHRKLEAAQTVVNLCAGAKENNARAGRLAQESLK